MLQRYPVCLVYSEDKSKINYVYSPDLRLKFLGGELSEDQSLSKVLIWVKLRMTSYIQNMVKAGLRVALPGNIQDYKGKVAAEDRIWMEVQVDVPYKRGLFEIVVPSFSIINTLLVSISNALVVMFAADLSWRHINKKASIPIALFNIFGSTLMVSIGYYLTGSLSASKELGRSVDDKFRKIPSKDRLREIAAKLESPKLSKEKIEAEVAWVDPEAIPTQTTAEDKDVAIFAASETTAHTFTESLKRQGMRLGILLCMAFEMLTTGIVIFQGSYQLGTQAFERRIPERVVFWFCLLNVLLLSIEAAFMSLGSSNQIVQGYDAQKTQELIAQARDEQRNRQLSSSALTQIGIFTSAEPSKEVNSADEKSVDEKESMNLGLRLTNG